MNKKGQALVEFVLVLPIILILVLLSFDFGRIYYEKTKLENTLNDVVIALKDKNNTIEEIKGKLNKKTELNLKSKDNGYIEVSLDKNITVFCPGLNLIIGNPHQITATRTIKYEQ